MTAEATQTTTTPLDALDAVDRLIKASTSTVTILEEAIFTDSPTSVTTGLERLARYISTGGDGSGWDWDYLQHEATEVRNIIDFLIRRGEEADRILKAHDAA